MTIRKQILEAMAAAAMAAPSLNGRIYRSRTAALARAESPALIIRPAEESTNSLGEAAERDFIVQFIVLARGEVPDDIADAVIEEVHACLWTDPTFGDLVARLFKLSSSWTFSSADGEACELDVRYRVRYYTPEDSLASTLS